jgi:RNA polymerase sigma-70 factor, ECF subfamily
VTIRGVKRNRSRLEEFREFAEASYEHVYRATYLAVGDRELASDGTQEAYVRAFAHWSRLSREPWVEGWVITTAVNTCKRALRRAARKPRSGQAPPGLMEEKVASEVDMVQALRQLSVRQRQAVVLHYLADVPVRGVAELMEVSEGTVKSHLAHARETLRNHLEVADV